MHQSRGTGTSKKILLCIHGDYFAMEFIEQLLLIVATSIMSVLAGTATWYLRTRGQCLQAMNRKIDAIDKRSWRIGKAVILSMQAIDTHANINHPKARLELEKLAKELIDDEPDFD